MTASARRRRSDTGNGFGHGTSKWPVHHCRGAGMTIGEKLDPCRFSAMSPKMSALVAYVLGDAAVHEADPKIVEIIQLRDGGLLARLEGEVGASAFIGHISDFNRNWGALVAVAELRPEEIEHIHHLIDERVKAFLS